MLNLGGFVHPHCHIPASQQEPCDPWLAVEGLPQFWSPIGLPSKPQQSEPLAADGGICLLCPKWSQIQAATPAPLEPPQRLSLRDSQKGHHATMLDHYLPQR
jgi:hypothetical protein